MRESLKPFATSLLSASTVSLAICGFFGSAILSFLPCIFAFITLIGTVFSVKVQAKISWLTLFSLLIICVALILEVDQEANSWSMCQIGIWTLAAILSFIPNLKLQFLSESWTAPPFGLKIFLSSVFLTAVLLEIAKYIPLPFVVFCFLMLSGFLWSSHRQSTFIFALSLLLGLFHIKDLIRKPSYTFYDYGRIGQQLLTFPSLLVQQFEHNYDIFRLSEDRHFIGERLSWISDGAVFLREDQVLPIATISRWLKHVDPSATLSVSTPVTDFVCETALRLKWPIVFQDSLGLLKTESCPLISRNYENEESTLRHTLLIRMTQDLAVSELTPVTEISTSANSLAPATSNWDCTSYAEGASLPNFKVPNFKEALEKGTTQPFYFRSGTMICFASLSSQFFDKKWLMSDEIFKREWSYQ